MKTEKVSIPGMTENEVKAFARLLAGEIASALLKMLVWAVVAVVVIETLLRATK